jgi:predicted glycoside hydrolase/deacetylase ChbG (UPF0249 family)
LGELTLPGTEKERFEREPTQGLLVINADDWGQDDYTTKCILSCVRAGTVTSVSAMVFMEDSVNGAEVARVANVDAGLHINLTTPFTAPGCPTGLRDRQSRIVGYLRAHRWARMLFHPLLVADFDYVVKAQLEEFQRLYGAAPARLDGHHHMHLCANVLLQRLLPAGTRVRRNLSFAAGEKSVVNRAYRRCVDTALAHRHRLTDFLLTLDALCASNRVEWALQLARVHLVEIETHPAVSAESAFLASAPVRERLSRAPLVSFAEMRGHTLPRGDVRPQRY